MPWWHWILILGCWGLALANPAPTLQVVTTVNFVTDLVQQIGGSRIKVNGLMGPGVDPHLYKATAGDVRLLQRADAIFYLGLNLEGKMTDLFARLPRAVALGQAIPPERLIQPAGGFEGRYLYDPHVWFDVQVWRLTLAPVVQTLSQLDPAGAPEYRQRAQAYDQQLQQLDRWILQEIGQIPVQQRLMITAHDAFAYFGRRYGLEVRGLQGLSTASEVGARDVQKLAQLIAERQIGAIFVETSVSRRTLEAVVAAVRARGGKVQIGGELFSDAAGSPTTPEGTYLGMMRHNVQTLVSGLKGKP